MSAPVQDLVQRLNAKRSGNGWMAKCPGHDDRTPSLSISEGSDGRALIKCFAGCELDNILAALNMKKADLFPPKATAAATSVKNAATEAPKPVVQPLPLGELLDAVRDTVRKYVSFQIGEQPTAIALWVLHTWAFEAAYFTPYLHIFSAETSSGKSRLLEVLALLVNKPWKTDNPSTSTLFRRIQAERPTLLHDEIDNVFRGTAKDDDIKDLRGCLNSGFKWDGCISRCVGQHANLEVKDFSTFSPKALAGIGEVLSDTLSNRCIKIKLVRRTREERVERFREREARAELHPLRCHLEAWAQQPGLIDSLKAVKTPLPDELTDRQQDICEPLLAIADLADGDWPHKARLALMTLCQRGGDTIVSTGVQLLIDLKFIFDEEADGKLSTASMLDRLTSIEGDRLWAAWWLDDLKHDKPQKPASRLAKLLKPYGIKARKIRIDDDTCQGYVRADFEETWRRYLPSPEKSGTSGTSGTHEGENVPASRNVPALIEQGGTAVPLVSGKNVPDVPDVPASREDWENHRLLTNLVNVLKSEISDGGLYPKGYVSPFTGEADPEVYWSESYPNEYTCALDCVDESCIDPLSLDEAIARLVFKIKVEAGKGRPLQSKHRIWQEGSYPAEFLAARDYIRKQDDLLLAALAA